MCVCVCYTLTTNDSYFFSFNARTGMCVFVTQKRDNESNQYLLTLQLKIKARVC